MAYMTKTNDEDDETLLSEDNSIPRSFLTMHVTDPFATALEGSSEENYPNAKKNLLEDLNSAEQTMMMMPPPPQKENIEVYLRVKPKTTREKNIASEEFNKDSDSVEETVTILSEHQVDLLAPQDSQTFKNSVNGVGKMKHHFTFSKILKPDVSQEEIFSTLVQNKVKDCLEGQNQLLFTYGATSAGKTFTMQGVQGNSGIIPRSIDTIFNTIGSKVRQSPVQPLGFNRVISITEKDMESLRKEKESVFRLGLELGKRSRPPSPDTSTLSGCSASSAGSSVASGVSLDLANLLTMFPSVATRDKELATLEIKDEHISYSVWVSFVEIYNENCHDLLVKVSEGKKKGEKVKRPTLRLAEDKDGLPYVKGLREIPVSSADEAYQVLMTGRENLHFAATKLNQQSSRSHCIFSLKILRLADPDRPHLARVSMFSFCDLAGSERISKTNNVGVRQKEAGNINTSLLILGRCIKAMRHNQTCKDKKGLEMVPFRESKLTRLFKSYLTGQGKSSLITCISQAEYLFDETVHVCKFASIASKVTIETVKEPQAKKKPVTSRFSTMVDREKSKLLSLASNASVLGRSSIAWELPPQRAKNSSIFGCFKPNARSTIAPGSLLPPRMSSLMNISEIQDVEDETVMENTVVQNQYESLLKLVDDLKTKLIEERKKNLSLEKNLREELCNEFNQMLVEVEQGYEQRIQDQIAEAERVNEWRLGEINNVHSMRNKRKREDDSGDFDEEKLAKIRLEAQLEEKTQAEQVLVQEVEDLKQEVTAMKDATMKSKQEQDKLQAANSKVQFELAEQQRLAAELGRELANTESKLVDERKKNQAISDGETDALLESERQLAEAREKLEQMETDVSDLKDLISEAGDDFIQKDEELQEALKECKDRESQMAQLGLVIQDQQGQLDECHVLLQEVNNQLEEKEQKLEELEQETEAQESAKRNQLQARVVELEDELRLTKSQYLTADDLSSELKKNLEEAENATEEERGRAKQAEEKMLEAQQERNHLLSVKSKLLQEIAEIRTRKGSGSEGSDGDDPASGQELQEKVDNLTALNKVLSESNEGLRQEKEESQKEIQSLKLKIDELKAATSVDESLFEDEDDIRLQVSSLHSENVRLQDNLSSAETEMETLKSEKRRLLSQIENQEKENFDEIENMVEKVSTLEDQLRREKESYESKVTSISEGLKENVSELEKTVESLQQEISEKESLLVTLKDEKEKLEESIENLTRETEAREILEKEIKSKEDKISKLENDLKVSRDSKSVKDQEVSMNVINLETRNGSLEKELATKDNYIKELEDVIVEKEFRISELEKSPDDVDGVDSLEKEISSLKKSLTTAAEERAAKDEKIQKLKMELSEMTGKVEHQEKMKEQRESLEKRVNDCKQLSESLSNLEDELKNANLEKKNLSSKLEVSEKQLTKLRDEVNESRGEIKALKKATKDRAKEALEASELRMKNEEFRSEIERLQSIVKAETREQNALDVLKSELASKSGELSLVQEKVEQLRTELGGKDQELSQVGAELERLRHETEAKEYDLNKVRDERSNLMEHYEKQFKLKQAEIDNLKASDKEKQKMEEILAKATPSKSIGEMKEKLGKALKDLKETKGKLLKEEEEVSTLRKEFKSLQKELDTKLSQHEREMKRSKLASDKVIAEYRETNKQLQRRVEVSVTPASPQDPSPTLEADDSKTDTSLIESTPMAKRRGGRGRGRGRATRSNASLASFEDSNTENEPEAGRPRVASVSRQSRVTRASKSVLADLEGKEEEKKNRSVSRKRVAATRSDSSVLKEKQMLSPVVESESLSLTPAQKKKRKLYSQTPQHSQIFTPPTDQEQDTPGSVVKKQLRARRAKKN